MQKIKNASLEILRQRVDLVELISSYVDIKRQGATYKGLCPFHDEKTPSFTVQQGDSHYHCFGCGAHGDAIQFLMSHLNLTFVDAVETLAERFHVILEKTEEKEGKSNSKKIKDSLEAASYFYHFCLLHTKEGHIALEYLFKRGVDLDFIRRFRIGYAPNKKGIFRSFLHSKGFYDSILVEAGLLREREMGGYWDFFSERIMFPIFHPTGQVIGFSARKIKEETYGGKYINSPETPVFKKSRTFFALYESRRRIAKEGKALLVEGQIDALRLINLGFDYVVAPLGTAFGQGLVKELLNLGVKKVYLSYDSDEAGKNAAVKAGDFFLREGVEVRVVCLPEGMDPDSFVLKEGPVAFQSLIDRSKSYLPFLVEYKSKMFDVTSPSGKQQLIKDIVPQIRSWNHSVIVHDSLKALAKILNIPEEMVGVGHEIVSPFMVRRQENLLLQDIDPNQIIEADFIRWLLLNKDETVPLIKWAKQNISLEDLSDPLMKTIYQTIVESEKKIDLLSLAISLGDNGQEIVDELLKKRLDFRNPKNSFIEAMQKILNRNWLEKRDELRLKIQTLESKDEEVQELVQNYDSLSKKPPVINLNEESTCNT